MRLLRWRLSMALHYERGQLPWARAGLSLALLRRGVYVRRPFHGNAYQMLTQGRLEIGPRTVLEAGVTVQSASGRIRLGQQCRAPIFRHQGQYRVCVVRRLSCKVQSCRQSLENSPPQNRNINVRRLNCSAWT